MPQRSPTSETNVPPPWKVSELARRTGVTVRTLHHYDAIGLLTPSNRTPGAHRLYSSEDVARLHQIHSLRTLGFPLAEIRAMLAAPSGMSRGSPLALVNAHRAHLRARIDAEMSVLARLDAIAEHLGDEAQPSVSVLCSFLHQLTALQRVERHFTPQQLAELAAVHSSLGSEQSKRVVDRWQTLIPVVADAMAAGVAPESPEAQALVAEWHSLLALGTGNDTELSQAARQMYEQDGDALAMIMPHRPTSAMFEYIAQAARAGSSGRSTSRRLQRRRT